jgi:hypothetical protein
MADRLIRRDSGPSAADAREEIFLTEKQLASRHQLSVKTLRNARVTGSYIRFVRLGRTVRYRLSDVIAYEEANLVRSTSDRPSDAKQLTLRPASEAENPALLISRSARPVNQSFGPADEAPSTQLIEASKPPGHRCRPDERRALMHQNDECLRLLDPQSCEGV